MTNLLADWFVWLIDAFLLNPNWEKHVEE